MRYFTVRHSIRDVQHATIVQREVVSSVGCCETEGPGINVITFIFEQHERHEIAINNGGDWPRHTMHTHFSSILRC